MSRVLLIGWDGADWRILDPLLEAGILPNLASLIDRGEKGVLRSTIPNHSWAAWPSFLTGLEPSNHGVYDIFERDLSTHRQIPVTFGSIQEPTMLPDLDAAGVTTVMTNVPLTFPPPSVNGKLVAGGVLPRGRTYTHPTGLAAELEAAGAPFPINGMSWTTFWNRPEPFLEEAMEITRARIRANEHLLDTTDWGFASLVFVATDRVQHCLAKYVSPDHPEYSRLSREPLAEKVRDVYRLLDEGLGSLVSRTNEDDLVLFMSDHGFHSCTRAVHMDRLLERLGLLRFAASRALFGPLQWGRMRAVARKVYDLLGLHGKVSLTQSVNWRKTTAYTSVRSTGEGVSINVAGREPDGVVDPADYERARERVMDALTSFVDPDTGRSPVAGAHPREEIFRGHYAKTAPDIVLEPGEGYSLTHAKAPVADADWLSGDHRMEGVVAAAGPHVRTGAFAEGASLVDLAPTILAALSAPSPIKHDGGALTSVVGEEREAMPASGAPASAPASEPQGEGGLDSDEALEVEEHLRGLGYIE